MEDLKICKKTLKQWKTKMETISKLQNVTIDRALTEMIFTQKCQVECFEYLKKDLNYFATFEEVQEHLNISRYLYKVVKAYIREELTKAK